MKRFLFLAFCLSSWLFAPLLSQPCPIPNSLLNSFYESYDIPILALEQMHGWPDVEVPESLKHPIRQAFAAMFNAAETVPEADSIINYYCVHTTTDVPQGIYIYIDTSYAWVKGWRMMDTLTTHPVLDSMIERYDLNVYCSTGYGYISTTRLQNFYPVIDTVLATEGVLHVQEGGWIGDGSHIYYTGGGLVFVAKWGDCPSGCQGERVYAFDIVDSCTALFTGAQTTRPYPPGHPDIFNCQLTTSTHVPQQRQALHIYPNPAEERIAVDYDEESAESFDYVIYDLLGRINIRGTSGGREVDIAELNAGGYVIVIRREDEIWMGRFVKGE